MITWIVGSPMLVKGTLGFSTAIVNVMISRLVLNLRSFQRSSHTHKPTRRRAQSLHIHVEEVEMSDVPLSPKIGFKSDYVV
jgi:hypothetical protein